MKAKGGANQAKRVPAAGANRQCKSRARGQKYCLWGCAGLWRVLWGRSQRLFSPPDRYLAAEGAVLAKTNCPTSAGLAPPGHRMARKRLQSAPLAGTQALGRGQLLYMHRVGSVGFSVGPISAFWLGGAGLSPGALATFAGANQGAFATGTTAGIGPAGKFAGTAAGTFAGTNVA